MEKKNSILLIVIAVATLLIAVVGATFAYFTATIQDNRTAGDGQGDTKISTDQVVSSIVTANIPSAAGSFTVQEVYPGHKEVAALQVTVSGQANAKTGADFKYDVTTNTLNDQIKVSLYKSDLEIGTTDNFFECTKEVRTVPMNGNLNEVQYYEACKPDLDKLTSGTTQATLIGSHVLSAQGGTQRIDLGRDIIDLSSIGSRTVYYYVVVEFMDSNKGDQNQYMSKTLEGVVSVEPAPGIY